MGPFGLRRGPFTWAACFSRDGAGNGGPGPQWLACPGTEPLEEHGRLARKRERERTELDELNRIARAQRKADEDKWKIRLYVFKQQVAYEKATFEHFTNTESSWKPNVRNSKSNDRESANS